MKNKFSFTVNNLPFTVFYLENCWAWHRDHGYYIFPGYFDTAYEAQQNALDSMRKPL